MAAAAIPRALTLTRTMRRPAGPKISTDPGPHEPGSQAPRTL